MCLFKFVPILCVYVQTLDLYWKDSCFCDFHFGNFVANSTFSANSIRTQRAVTMSYNHRHE